MLVVACVTAAGCPGGCGVPEILTPGGVQSVSVAPSLTQLIVGQTQQYTATVQPNRYADDGLTWSVAPAAVASIDSKGLLTALAPGQAVVKVTTVATPVHSAEAALSIVSASRN